MYCPRCGNQLSPQDRFCSKCGHPMPDVPNHTPSPSQAPAPTPPGANQQPPIQPTVAPKRSKATLPLAIVAAVLLVAVIAVGFAAFGAGESSGAPGLGTDSASASGSSSTTGSSVAGGSVEDKSTGKTIQALARPQLLPPQSGETSQTKPTVKAYNVQSGLSNVSFVDEFYLQDDEKSLLEKYGFFVSSRRYGYQEFYEVYEFNRYNMLPNFVTVDSLMHTYHLYFQHLQKNAEKGSLGKDVAQMSKDLLSTSEKQLEALKGTEWEDAARRNVAFFAVGACLQDPSTSVPSEVKSLVDEELSHIESASGVAKSSVTGDDEDYSQYIVRGYYEGDESLERYFRTMMWYGRMNFKQKDEELDRSALLMTLALEGDALEQWEAVYTVTSFFAGASDDCGYYEYKPLIDAAYGEGATVDSLPGNTKAWQHFHKLTAEMNPPQINSVPLGEGEDGSESRTDEEKGFRLMGQRFSLDEMVFTQLLFPNVGTNSQGRTRTLPDALDVPAAMGSDEALDILKSRGATSYAKYEDNMRTLRDELADETDTRWSASLYSQWLYTLNPLLKQKGEGYPSFMQSSQWARKDLQTYLGSFTELKHDTILYAKQVMAEMGGEPIETKDDRGYVEPEPEVFSRLARLTDATSKGLKGYGMLSAEDESNLALLYELANDLSGISKKELESQSLTDDEYDLIRTYGGQIEHFWEEVYKGEAKDGYFTSKQFPAAIVADVATDGDAGTVLELGTGRASNIYVIVEVEGQLKVCSGSTYSFYQFEHPMSDRLTDTKWRQMMGIELNDEGKYQEPEKQLEDWTDDFTSR